MKNAAMTSPRFGKAVHSELDWDIQAVESVNLDDVVREVQ
jgi:hypothetical protein